MVEVVHEMKVKTLGSYFPALDITLQPPFPDYPPFG